MPARSRSLALVRWSLVAVHGALAVTLVANTLYLRRQRRAPLGPRAPRVSVLIPARNEARNLPRLLASLWAQTYPDFEVIVYDDGSTDATTDVLAADRDSRLVRLRGEGPPPGWVGKVHALYQATRVATGDVFLFLDADAELAHPGALLALAERHAALPEPSVLTGIPDLGPSGGKLLVGLVAHSILVGLPWWAPRRLRTRSLGAINGQVWMIGAAVYRQYEPHLNHRDRVLEDVEIGRSLRAAGVVPVLAELRHDVRVWMYADLGEAWGGFRKNAYLILGGTPRAFAAILPFYVATFVLAPLASPWLLGSLVAMRAWTDRLCGLPPWHALYAPVSYAASVALALDSARAHLRGRVRWKGRAV